MNSESSAPNNSSIAYEPLCKYVFKRTVNFSMSFCCKFGISKCIKCCAISKTEYLWMLKLMLTLTYFSRKD